MVKNFNLYLFKVEKNSTYVLNMIHFLLYYILMTKNKLQFIHKMWSNRNKVQIWVIYVVYITEVNHKTAKHFYISWYVCVDSNELFISSLTFCPCATIVSAEKLQIQTRHEVYSLTRLSYPDRHNSTCSAIFSHNASPCHVFCLKLLGDWFHLKNLMTFPFRAGRNDWCSLLLNQCNFIQ